MDMIFDAKYVEFAKDLLATCPELDVQIKSALALDTEDRMKEVKKQVLTSCSPRRDGEKCPDYVLPGVPMTQEIWASLSEKSKKAIQEYMTILSFTFLIDAGTSSDVSGSEWSADWAKTMMDDMKEKMGSFDFTGMSAKIDSLFGSMGGANSKEGSGSRFPELPEKFLNGQIAKLAEDIVKELKMEDFGLDPEVLKSAGNDPTKALSLIMEVLMKNPQNLQKTIQKLSKKIQQKIQSGALRPNDLVAEAEELMKTFSENPQFVSLMESFRQSFGAFNPEVARNTNREGEHRMNIVKERLRKKLAEKNAKKNNK
jgi:hypothetical protein